MRRITSLCNVALLFVSLDSWAKDPYVDIDTTMCREGETIYISCALDGGADPYSYIGAIASVCAKNNVSPETGYVQYRYGKPADGRDSQITEMEFPTRKVPPRGIFKIYSSDNPNSIAIALRFTSGKYVYSFERHGLDGYYVIVRQQGKKVFQKSCTLPGKNYLIGQSYEGIEHINLKQQIISDSDK